MRKISLFTASLLTVACIGSQGFTVNAAIPCPQSANGNLMILYGSDCNNSSLGANQNAQSNNSACGNQALPGQVQNYLQDILSGCSNLPSAGNCPTIRSADTNTNSEAAAQQEPSCQNQTAQDNSIQNYLNQILNSNKGCTQNQVQTQNPASFGASNETPARTEESVKNEAVQNVTPQSQTTRKDTVKEEAVTTGASTESTQAGTAPSANSQTAVPAADSSANGQTTAPARNTQTAEATQDTASSNPSAPCSGADNAAPGNTGTTCGNTSCTDRTFTVNTYNGRTLTIKVTGNRCTVIDDCRLSFCQPACNSAAAGKNNNTTGNTGNNRNGNSNTATADTGKSNTGNTAANTGNHSDANNSGQTNAGNTTTTKTNGSTTATTSNTSYAEQVVALVNAERAKVGLSALTIDSSLQTAAQVRAKEIETSFSHTRPDGTSFSTAIKAQGISYRTAGENIAYGQRSPEEVVNAWMNSEGHRANILNSGYNKIGVGYYQNSRGVNYWSQEFTN